MKPVQFEITLDRPHGVYYVGETVTGNVIVRLSQDTKMRSIVVYFKGEGKSDWEIKRGPNYGKYRAEEVYVDSHLVLFGALKGSPLQHSANRHVYPFSVQIPPTVPSSFEGMRGYVRYLCHATLEIPWGFNQSIQKPFTVIRPLDLNALPIAANPIRVEHREPIRTCCCDRGSVRVNFVVGKTGFVPGEAMMYRLHVDNQSKNMCTDLEIQLRQIGVYTGFPGGVFSASRIPRYHTKIYNHSLYSGPFAVPSNQTEDVNETTMVPSLPPSYLEGCGVIKLQYKIAVKMVCGWSKIEFEKEVLIGTVPLQTGLGLSSYQASLAPPQPTIEPSAPPMEEMTSRPYTPIAPPNPPPYEYGPPSYEESVFGRVTIPQNIEEGGSSNGMSWAPAYPCYTLPNQPSHQPASAKFFSGQFRISSTPV